MSVSLEPSGDGGKSRQPKGKKRDRKGKRIKGEMRENKKAVGEKTLNKIKVKVEENRR